MNVKDRSKVWDYFDVSEADNTKAICHLCKCSISRCGAGKSATTSSMLKHLKFKHNSEFNMIKPGPLKTAEPNTKKKSAPAQTQMSLEESLQVKWAITDKRSIAIHNAIGEMLALDNQPYSIVSDTG